MRLATLLLASLSPLVVTTANAAALAAQDPAIKVSIHTDASNTTWYTSPAALAIGGLVVLLIVVLAVMASRKKGTTTTIIR